MNDFVKTLAALPESTVLEYIRTELTKDGKRLRFDMSGYDNFFTDQDRPYNGLGTCVKHNTKVLQTFAHLGIYDTTHFLYLDFYKGIPTLYWMDWGSDKLNTTDDAMSGYSTSEIIYEVFKVTIFNENATYRRRD